MALIADGAQAQELFESAGRLKINSVKASASQVEIFDTLELTVDLSARYTNPFDSDQIELIGHFITPSEKEIAIPGFYYLGFSRSEEDGKEILTETGRPHWKVRFTPTETGTYTYQVSAKDATGTVASRTKRFEVSGSDRAGFIRVDKNSRMFMKFDNQEPYFAVGEAIAWASPRKQTYEYEYYFDKLARNGCNYSRIWMVEWNLALEWKDYDKTSGKAYGLAKYSPDNSWRLDYILGLAKKQGLYLVLTVDTYGSVMDKKGNWNEERWSVNPYNKANGGPCETPKDFWTDQAAKELYKRRLRYILSRWGHSPNILAFELWNEVDAPQEWTEEMAGFIKEHDPYGHLVTTSLGYGFQEKHLYDTSRIWNLDSIDYVQTHLYGKGGDLKDLAQAISDISRYMAQKYRKPHLIGEFGIDYYKDDAYYDKEGKGVQIHNALWASVMSKSFGTAMTHWKEYIDRKDLYHQFKAVANFVRTIDWLNGTWEYARIEIANAAPKEKKYSEVVLSCPGDWAEECPAEVTVLNNGEVSGRINRYIHGVTKQSIRVTPVFHVNFPAEGRLVLDVHSVAQGADLGVFCDGKEIWRHKFGAGPGEGEWKSCRLLANYNVYVADYGKQYEIGIPAGDHEIRFENVGKDWVRLSSITLSPYRDESIPPVRALGLSKDDEAIVWVQNTESTWFNEKNKLPLTAQKDIVLKLSGLRDGAYTLAWWDTWKGERVRNDTVTVVGGSVTVSVPEFERDVAFRIEKNSI